MVEWIVHCSPMARSLLVPLESVIQITVIFFIIFLSHVQRALPSIFSKANYKHTVINH